MPNKSKVSRIPPFAREAESSKLPAEARRSAKVILYKNGRHSKPNGSNSALAVMRELLVQAEAKQTQAVSIQTPVSGIEAAEGIAVRTRLRHGPVKREIISKGLRQD